MKKLRLTQLLNLYMLAVVASGYVACKKNNPKPVIISQQLPVITSLSTTSGPFGTIIIISGSGFDSELSNDKVFFNGKAAVVTVATSNQLTTTVPVGAGTGNVTLVVNNQSSIKGPVFTYQFIATVSTFAGSGAKGLTNGPGRLSSFNEPIGIAVDANDNVYVADTYNNVIRKISSGGIVTTLAGSGMEGSSDGIGIAASFYRPEGLAVDLNGNVYVADTFNGLIRKITPQGVVSTILSASRTLSLPINIAVDASGNLYVSYPSSNVIAKVSPSGSLTILAGSSESGTYNGPGIEATFFYPTGVAVDASDNVYVGDTMNNMIRKIDQYGVVSLLAGRTGSGSDDGIGAPVSFHWPWGVAVDAADNVYVADYLNSLIRKVTAAGEVTTIAGNGVGSTNGIGTSASFNLPFGVAVDAAGNVFVADTFNYLIRKITFK